MEYVQHPTLGTLKFPKSMPFDERNESVDRAMSAYQARQAVPLWTQTPQAPASPIPSLVSSHTSVTPPTGTVANVKRGVGDILGFPKQVVQAFVTPPQTPEETAVTIPGLGRTGQMVALATKRLLVDPQLNEYEAAGKERPQPGDTDWNNATERAHAHLIAAAVPVLGPIASDLSQQYLSGDHSGALARLGTYITAPEIAHKLFSTARAKMFTRGAGDTPAPITPPREEAPIAPPPTETPQAPTSTGQAQPAGEPPTPGEQLVAPGTKEVTPGHTEWNQYLQDVRGGKVYHGTTEPIATRIRAQGLQPFSMNKTVKDVASRIGFDLKNLTPEQKEELGGVARSYNMQLGESSFAASPKIAARWAGKGGEVPARIEAILRGSDKMEEYGAAGTPTIVSGQLTERGKQAPGYTKYLRDIERLNASVVSGELSPSDALVHAQEAYHDIRLGPGDVALQGPQFLTPDPATGKLVPSTGAAAVGTPPAVGSTGLDPFGRPFKVSEMTGETGTPVATPAPIKPEPQWIEDGPNLKTATEIPSMRDQIKTHPWFAAIKELDAKGAPDSAYRSILSTGGKDDLVKGETWRQRVLKYTALDVQNRARIAAEAAKEAKSPSPIPGWNAERVQGGKVKMGADVASLGKILGASLYQAEPAKVITKELLQNAFDAVRESSGDKNVHVDLSAENGTITVTDTGKGLTRQELETVFTDLGSSGKRTNAAASGGFGLAKAAPLMIAKRLEVTTVSDGPGGRMQHSFISTPDELLGSGVEIQSIRVPRDTPLGTRIVAHLPDEAKDDIYNARNFLTNTGRSLRPPGKLSVTENGQMSRRYGTLSALPEKPDFTARVPGADIAVHSTVEKNPGPMGAFGGIDVEINNNGIYQMNHTVYAPGMKGVRGAPNRIAVDIRSNVDEGHGDYPFTANREEVRTKTLTAIDDAIKTKILNPLIDREVATMGNIYRNLPSFELHSGRKVAIYDAGGRMTPQETKELLANPHVAAIAATIDSIVDNALNKLLNTPARDYNAGGWGKKVERTGLLFSESQTGRIHGLFAANPDNKLKATLFINPFAGIAGATPEEAASLIWHTIKHEIVHDHVSGHNETFTSGEVRMASTLGAEHEINALRRLKDVYADPTAPNSGRIRPGLDRPLQIYAESRTRSETTTDIFGGEALNTTRPQDPQDREGATPVAVPTSGSSVVPERGVKLHGSAFGLDYLADDLSKLWKDKGPGLAEALNSFRKDFTPRAFVDPKTLDSVMKMTGQRERNRFVLDNIMHTAETSLGDRPKAEQIDFIDRMKRGEDQATPALNDLAKFMRQTDDDSYIRLADSQVRNLGKTSQKLWASMSAGDKLRFAYDAKRLAEDEDVSSAAKDIAKAITDYKEDHFRVFWKTLPGKVDEETGELAPGRTKGSGQGTRPLAGDEGFKRRSTLATISEGIERGGEPYSYNPVTLFKMSQASLERSITAHNMWNDAKDMGNIVFQRGLGRPPEGWTTINDRMGIVRYVDDAGKIGNGQWVAQEGFGRLLNNMLSDDFLKQRSWVKGLISTKNYLTAYRLGFSAFHYMTEGLSAIASQVGEGMQKVNRSLRGGGVDAFKAGVRDLATAPYAPRSTYKVGADIVKYVTNKDEFIKSIRGQDFLTKYPEVDQMLDDLFSSGAKLALHEDEALGAVAKLRQTWAEPSQFKVLPGKSIKLAWQGFWAGAEKVYAPLFQYYIPRLKAGAFFKEYSEALVEHEADIAQGFMTRGEVGRRVWNSVEDRFGQVNWDKFFWKRSLKTSSQVAFRATQWFAGNVRFTSNALRGQFEDFQQSSRYIAGKLSGNMSSSVAPSTGIIPKLDPNFAKLLGLVTTYTTLNAITQMAAGQGAPKDYKDLFAARIGGVDNFGQPKRITWPAIVIKDTQALYGQGPVKYVAGKLSDVISGVYDVLENRDFRRQMIFDPQAEGAKGVAENVGRGVGHIIGGPISVESALQADTKGSAIMGGMGLRPPVTGYGWDKFQNYVFNTSRHQMEAQTPQEAAKTQQFYKLQTGLATKQITVPDINKKFLAGDLSENDYNRLLTHMATRMSPLEQHFEILHVDQMLRAYELASPEQQKLVKPLMDGKMGNLKAYSRKQQVALIQKYESLTHEKAPFPEEEEVPQL